MTVRNGLTLAYVVALLNAVLALVIAFGVVLTAERQAAIVAFMNAAIMLGARVVHLPERTPQGIVTLTHVPVLALEPEPEAPPAPLPAVPLPLSPTVP